MKSLSELKYEFKKAMQKVNFRPYPENLYTPIDYILGLNSKQLRPVLLLLSSEMFGGDIESAIKPAMAIEWFHNFTLMHDDIMDQAPLRRGSETVHEKWSVNTAILSGDVMLVKAYQFLEDLDSEVLPKVFNLFNRTAVEVCEGQQLDMNYEQKESITEDMYVEMIRLKTAVLIACALKLGAVMAKVSEKEADTMYQIGENMGIAFQLQDDLLDAYGDPNKFGKQLGGDILTNKKTFLLISALKNANAQSKMELEKWLSITDYSDKQKVEAVLKIYDKHNIKELTKDKISFYIQKAFSLIEELSVGQEEKKVLKELIEGLLKRED